MSDAAAMPDAAGMHSRMDDYGLGRPPASPPPALALTPAATGGGGGMGPLWLVVYDRVSRIRFRLQMEDPLFLSIISRTVMPVVEADESLPYELHEFVTFLDAYERERLQQAAAARRGHTGSSSFAVISGGVTSASSGSAHRGVGNVHYDPATAAAAAAAAAVAASTTLGSAASMAGTSGVANGSGVLSNGSLGSGGGLNHHLLGNAAAPPPRKVEETLRLTLDDNSDFFFRVASVAYDLDPTTHGISPYAPSAAGAAAASMPTATAAAATGQPNSSVGAGVNGRGEGIPTTTAGGMASLLAGTIAATAATVAAAASPPPRRNYAVHSGYSAAFHLCGRLFGDVYRDNCQALAQKIAHGFSALRIEDCVKFRKAVWTGFLLKALEPYRSGARSESNLELRWVSEKIKDDQHLFPARGTAPQPHNSHMSRLVDATLSYVANARRRAQPGGGSSVNGGGGSGGGGGGAGVAGGGAGGVGGGGAGGAAAGDAEENEMMTYGLTKLLQSPSWQKDDDCSDACRTCGRTFISVSRPLGARAHHCRSCGVRLCVFCITKRAHYTFAKLAKPGSSDETEDRLVCDTCYKEYEAVSQLHYLGALFAFAGLGFSDLVLCRTVNEQWREAAELCISEYRLLLHNCDADLHSVKTPVGVLLQNSLFLLLGDGPVSSVPVVHHPEAALLLLKFIATENLWVPDASYYFILRLSSAVLNRADTVLTQLPSSSSTSPVPASSPTSGVGGVAADARHRGFRLPVVPTFSHWHLFCTAFCSKIASSYFFIKCAEHLCAAPAKVYDAYVGAALERMTRVYLSTTPLWRRLAETNRASAAAFAARASGAASSAPLPLPLLSDVTEGQVVTLWLLDMLHKDALVPPQRRRYQQVLERVIPTVAGASLSLVFVMLLSLQSTYAYYGYDEDLFGSWRARIIAEVGRRDAQARDRVLATLDFFNELDRFCAQSTVVSQTSMVEWIVGYCTRGAAAAGAAAATFPRRGLPPKRIDLPRPMLNPFKPYMIVKSIRLAGVRVAPNAASKPTWLAFSTWTTAEHEASDAAADRAPPGGFSSPPTAASATVAVGSPILPGSPVSTTSYGGAAGSALGAAPQECMFLYKRENVERDQLMCISSRLLQTLLACEIGNAEMVDYSVLPLSCDSGIIEKAEGRELSNLDNMDISRYVLHRGPQGCVNFLASAKLFLLLNYIFSIGDRHKGNVLIGTSGALLHIDFRFIFSEKTFVEKLARSTVRIDDAFLAAVEQCQQRQSSGGGGGGGAAGANPAAPCTHAACGASPAPPLLPAGAPASRHVTPPQRSPSSGGRRASVGAAAGGGAGPAEPSSAEIREAFFSSAAEWFVHVRPHASVFYELWLYAVHRHTVPYNEAEMLNMLNTLFDRHASQTSSASKFSTTMKESVNVCRLKDVTHSSAEVLRSFADQVSRRFSGGSVDAVKMVGTAWSSWWSRGG